MASWSSRSRTTPGTFQWRNTDLLTLCLVPLFSPASVNFTDHHKHTLAITANKLALVFCSEAVEAKVVCEVSPLSEQCTDMTVQRCCSKSARAAGTVAGCHSSLLHDDNDASLWSYLLYHSSTSVFLISFLGRMSTSFVCVLKIEILLNSINASGKCFDYKYL